MTNEEKQPLFKDLCARFPYGVIVRNEEGYEGHLNSINQTIFGIELGVNITATCRVDFQLDTCKPYLRPMSSMTEEEQRALDSMCDGVEMVSRLSGLKMFDKAFDWLNEHHFDYRGLIPMGLALEAPEGMYKF